MVNPEGWLFHGCIFDISFDWFSGSVTGATFFRGNTHEHLDAET
jgi:hypothetical protein